MILGLQVMSQQVSPEVISSAGDHFQNEDISLSWTLGEPVIATFSGEYILTQGFHQDMYIITSIDELTNVDFDIEVYPNPTPDRINIRWSLLQEHNDLVLIQILDMSGKIMYEEKINENAKGTQINLNNLHRSAYLMKVTYQKQTKTYKIVKS